MTFSTKVSKLQTKYFSKGHNSKSNSAFFLIHYNLLILVGLVTLMNKVKYIILLPKY